MRGEVTADLEFAGGIQRRLFKNPEVRWAYESGAISKGRLWSDATGAFKIKAALVKATFWVETVAGAMADGPDFHQLQYTQTVLLNFDGLSWPHITVANLRRSAQFTVREGDTLSAIALQFYGDGTEPFWRTIYNANIAVIGPDPDAIRSGQQLRIPS